MQDMRCMSFTSRGTTEILVAGMQDTMFVIDLNKREITKRVCLEGPGCLDEGYAKTSSRYPRSIVILL